MIQALDFCLVCPMPIKLLKNPEGRLHSLTDYAIEWQDGYKLAFIDGIYIDYDLFEQFINKRLSYKQILDINNIEQRYIMLKYYGTNKLLTESNAELISIGKNQIKLYKISSLINNKDLKLLRYYCPSTGREYISFVPFEYNDANKAMSWKFNITEEEYLRLKIET